MIVVADTSPINYLILIELQDLLPKLFGRILIPEAVHCELQPAAAPDPIKRFLDEALYWLEVRAALDCPPWLLFVSIRQSHRNATVGSTLAAFAAGR